MPIKSIARVCLLLSCMLAAKVVLAVEPKPWSEANDYVVLEAVNADNMHPVVFDAEQLRALLGRFYKQEDGRDPTPFFTADEINRLTNKLVPLLAKADRGDDVLFGSSFRPGLFSFLPRQINAGRLFVDSNGLNLLVGMCAEPEDTHYTAQHNEHRPLNHGSRATPPRALGCELVASHGAERVDNRTDWLHLLTNEIGQPVSAQAVVTPAKVLRPIDANTRTERMQLLDRMLQSGLIGRDEYEQKRKNIESE